MNTIQYNITVFIFSLFIFSCTKAADKIDDSLKITPESVVSYAGKDWASLSSEFSSKKGYRFTKLNNGAILAAMSLSAKDEVAPAQNFKLLFNINQENRVSVVILTSADSLNVTTRNKLFLYYYEKAFSMVHNVAYTSAIDSYNQQVNIGVQNLVLELNGLNCEEASLTYKNDVMDMNGGFSHGTFSVSIFAP